MSEIMAWIKTSDNLPEYFENVLICYKTPNGRRTVREGVLFEPTHEGRKPYWVLKDDNYTDPYTQPDYWQPLPEPPSDSLEAKTSSEQNDNIPHVSPSYDRDDLQEAFNAGGIGESWENWIKDYDSPI